MRVAVACTKCKARFSASERLRGKNVQCPACGTIVMISLMDEETRGLPDVPVLDLGEAAREKAEAERDVKAVAKTGMTSSAGAGGTMPEEILCPSCALPVKASVRVCTNCGYSFERSQVIKTTISAESTARVSARKDEFDFRGVRKNRDFQSMPLITLEAFLLPLANAAYGLLTAGILVYLWVNLGYAYNDVFADEGKLASPTTSKAVFFGISAALTVGLLIAAAAYYYIGTWFNLIGVRLAGKLLRFDLPPDESQRMVAMVAYYNILGVLVALLVLFVFGADQSGMSLDDRIAHNRAVIVGLQLFMLPVFFFMEMFFFRMRVFETLLAMLLQFATMVVLGLFVFVLILLIGLVYVGGR